MTPQRILMTGAGGFVGRHLLPALRAAFPAAALHDAFFDITDAAACAAAIGDFAPDACVHLAGLASIPAANADPDLAWRVNLSGTLTLARALLAGVPACRLLHVSTAEAYGASFRAGIALDETAPLAPANTYAASKAAADLALGAMLEAGLRVIRLRPFNHTGPGQSEAFVVAAFAAQLARIRAGMQEPVIRVGRLDAQRDFLDVRDVCAAYVACLARAETLPDGAILNIASGTPRPIAAILDALIALSGTAPRIEPDPARMRPSDIPTASGNAARVRTLLGWAPAIPWDKTLADTVAYWQRAVARTNPSPGGQACAAARF